MTSKCSVDITTLTDLETIVYERQRNTREGGNFHDCMKVFREHGIVPEEIYTGLNYDSPVITTGAQAFINAIQIWLKQKKESDQYKEIVNAVLMHILEKCQIIHLYVLLYPALFFFKPGN